MNLDRVQHYLGLAFFSALVITQALVFVAVKAVDNNYLSVAFVEPIADSIEQGEAFYFQAALADKGVDYDAVYFKLINTELGINQNYEASLQADGSYRAQSIFDSSLYPVATYYISVVAYDFEDGRPANIYNSLPKIINTYSEVQAAVEGDNSTGSVVYFSSPTQGQQISLGEAFHIELNVVESLARDITRLRFVIQSAGIEDQTQLLSFNTDYIETAQYNNGYYIYSTDFRFDGSEPLGDYIILIDHILANDAANIVDLSDYVTGFTLVNSSIANPDIFDAQIIEPLENETIVASYFAVKVQVNRPIDIGRSLVAYIANRENPQISGDYLMVADSINPSHYKATVGVATEVPPEDSGVPRNVILSDGSYTVEIYLRKADGTKTLLDATTINIAFGEDVPEVVPEININSPAAGATINADSLDISLSTNFEADNVYVELIKTNNTALSIARNINKTDGYSWQTSLDWPNDFINGPYTLKARATMEDGSIVASSPISLIWNGNLSDQNVVIDNPDNIHLIAYQPNPSTIGPGDILVGSANVAQVKFILREVSNAAGYELDPILVDCNNQDIITEDIREILDIANSPYCFMAYLLGGIESEIFNGNYNFYLEVSTPDYMAQSSTVPVTYFNDGNQVVLEDYSSQWLDLVQVEEDGKVVKFYLAANFDARNYDYTISHHIDSPSSRVESEYIDWEDLPAGFDRADYGENIYLYEFSIYIERNGTVVLQDKEYDFYVRFLEDAVPVYTTLEKAFVVADGHLEGYQSEGEDEQDEQIEEDQSEMTSEPEENNSSSVTIRRTVIDFFDSCGEHGIYDDATCMKFRATMDLLDETCMEQGIYEVAACEDYLYRIETDLECQENGIIGAEECKNYLLEKYGGQVDCRLTDVNLCNSILRNKYLNRLVRGQRQSLAISEATDPLLGSHVSTQELSDKLKAKGINSAKALPLPASPNTRVLVAKSHKEAVLEDEDSLTILNQAIIIIDEDSDGLSEDLEKYYGTDPQNADSDGDGYNDGQEVANGYDPLGPGKLTKDRTDLDKVILDSSKTIEQPKNKSDKIDRDFKVEYVQSGETDLTLVGKAQANTWVNLYIYSNLPLVMTTKTDDSGNWSYDIKNSLTDGHHRVFVTINDDTGKIVKQSRPISFLIKEARAVTADDYFDDTIAGDSVNSMLIYYILGGVLLIVLALGIIFILHKNKNTTLEV